ncbi:fimbrial biogenesis outer membrane usher protein [Enterobacter kobei]|uniref:fimbria/pilus outer membrane usher protein n=1 Tax=Enterobacter kobei TaxID=208224 RepID=UPI001BD3DD27|nr:fimbria/pilus outer membrane usher protein [Enterobacter kobei]EHN8793085.1 fimbrial biogenesis outer membrane usher protein [Enterobacter kobei]
MSPLSHAAQKRPEFRPSLMAVLVALLLPSVHAEARDYFNPALLQQTGTGGTVPDLSAFENGGQLPGRYPVDIYLNDEQVDSRDVTFFQTSENGLQPCLDAETLAGYGVRTELFPGLQPEGEQCVDFSTIPDSAAVFVFGAHRLNISIPQAAVNPRIRGYVSPTQWDDGINAALLHYSFSGVSPLTGEGSSQYLNLRPGLNLGAWRFRNYTTWNRPASSDSGGDKWNSVYTYAQRSIVPLKSQLTLGDSLSPSDVFDSVPFRGAQLASDDEMIPDSQRGYAPVVRGIARGNSAQVTIRQNGYVIYQTTVPAGAFEITDMYPTGGSGDLYVTIKEADGSEQSMVVPYASLPVLQREGRLQFSLTAGQYRAYDSSIEKTPFSQGTLLYGVGKGMTLYGGAQLAQPYRAFAAGVGQNLGGLGALSVDVTQAWSTPQNDKEQQGQSWRLRYSKSLAETGTHLAVAGYRYSTEGFYDLADVLESYRDKPSSMRTERKRNRAELTLSQDLGGERGYLSVGAISEDYWDNRRKTTSWNMSYNNSWNGISYSLNYAMNRNTAGGGQYTGGKNSERDDVLSLNLSIPLDKWLGKSFASYNVSSSPARGTVNTVGLNGTALEDNSLNWNLTQSHASQEQSNSGYGSVNYRGTYGEVNGAYSQSAGQRNLSYGLQGSIVAHAGGITAGQPMGETFGLVKVPGASNVAIQNQTGIRTDYRGYALVPNLMPYRRNDVTLNTSTLDEDVDLKQTSRSVVPTRGALVRAEYRAQVGQRVMMTLIRADGKPVPFGATVVNDADPDAGSSIVGDGGQVYLAGLSSEGTLKVQWGNDAQRQCRVTYRLSKPKTGESIPVIQGQCR